MSDFFSNIISILFIIITLMSFLYIPFGKKSNSKKIAAVLMIFTIIMFVIPENIIGKIPFIGGNVENFIHDFLNLTQQFKDINELSSSIEINATKLVEKTIKMMVIFIVDGFVIFISTIIMGIVHIVKKRGQKRVV